MKNITTDFLLQSREFLVNKPQDNEFILNQKRKELENLFVNQNKCHYNFSNEKLLANLNKEELISKMKTLSNNNFYDSNVIELIQCFINSITLPNINYSIGDKIKEYLNNLKQIGVESVNGVALTASLKQESDFFIIKAPRNPKNNDDLIHECFVAFNGTNLLRKDIPNFAIVYSLINCSAPIIDNKKVLSWCSNSETSNVSYAIYEKINDSISFRKYLDTCYTEDFMQYFLQILLALKVASEKIGFTHYDLHDENILMRKSKKENFYIKYNDFYIKSPKYIPTIIDYGMTHINFNGESYGNISSDLTEFNIKNTTNISHDCYKIFMFSMLELKYQNPEVYSKVGGIFKFFNSDESLDNCLNKQIDIFFSLYLQPDTIFKIDDFIQYCRNYMVNLGYEDPITTIEPEISNIFQCIEENNVGCRTKEELVTYLQIDDGLLPQTFLEFYDQINLIENKNILINKFKNKVNEVFQSEKVKIEKINQFLKIFKDNNTIFVIPEEINLFSEQSTLFIENFNNCMSFVNNYQQNTLLINSGLFLVSKYGGIINTIVLKNFYENCLTNLKMYSKYLVNIRDIFQINLNTINIFIMETENIEYKKFLIKIRNDYTICISIVNKII
jgi:hypothetical protein